MRVGNRSARSRLGRAAAACAVALAAAFAATAPSAHAEASGPAVDVTVNTQEGLGTIPATAYGLNSAVWDAQMNTPAVAGLLGQAGVGVLRYPGGSYGDIYHWQTNTAPGGYVAPGTDFDAFMGTVKTIGAQPMLIADYGSGTPQEAADWVRYANITKGYGAKYWEIGNEIYGNGYYGSGWETDTHTDKSPTAYADNVVQYASAMKAVDPSIKIGAVLTLPGNWPDGVLAAGDAADWNRTVLSIAGSAVDFVIVHWYPGGQGAATMLAEPAQLTGELAQLRQEIDQYAGANAANLQVALTEINSNQYEDTQPDALFGADAYFTALEDGVFTADWWDTHNGATSVGTAPDGATDYGDYGILSSGGCVGTTCEPAMNTPFPTYFALSMLSKVGRPGDTLVRAGTDQQLVAAHAVRQANGDLAVELVNKDPDNTYTVKLNYTGYSPSTATPTVYSYADEGTAITSAAQGSSSTQTLPPYSIETVVLTPSGQNATALTAPGAPTVSAVTDTSATVNWPASSGGAVTRYGVYRQVGTVSELLAESTSTGATLHNLVPGTSYTVNVLATDQAGHLSQPSAPLTFTTGTPSSSTCAASYQFSDGWGSGWVANITVTDTGPAAIDGWTLNFSFPDAGESVSSGWNGNWTTTGTSVRVTSLDSNAQLAPYSGNSTTVGFVGSNTGAYGPPTAISLNGTVCTTTYTS
ncbi:MULTISPECIES: cellulose binding domain-containing protein [Streptacidiphilus]|uniref:Cellulose binding domain-containing protein n=1 Tax=Streptacidiphilus cavernicola TaxID=3342716 RepID=A0ABV6UI92_9ACTN|nr:cellulose binding domain-containing protein [Streptacidiphilus jeojiense]